VRTRGIAGLLLAMVSCTTTAWAVSDDITATADVQTPLTVTGSQDLNFGTVFPGLNKVVEYTDAANGGQWDITGEPAAEVALSFTALPANLVNGPNNLPITYAATDAGHNTTDAPGTATNFDPAVGTTAELHAVAGELYVWIGGTVEPPEDLPAGVYTATVTLDLSYTGN
jgi:hypothetical protein